MTLEPIDQAANLARDCRGALADISLAQFRQYKISVTCTDHEAPGLAGIWPGVDVAITCIPGLGGGDPADVITILAKVTKWHTSRDEWAAEIAWQLEAEQRDVGGASIGTPGTPGTPGKMDFSLPAQSGLITTLDDL